MSFKTLLPVAALLLAGCTCTDCCTPKTDCCAEKTDCCTAKDPVVGNWGLKLPYEAYSAGHLIVTREADGSAKAVLLWRWASPMPMNSFKVEGNTFVIEHPWGFTFSGSVKGKELTGKAVDKKSGKEIGAVTGWRNPPLCDKASTKDAKFGAPIDLLAEGLDGWKAMKSDGPFAWKVTEENGEKVLSNTLPIVNGKKQYGANLMSKRDDFYDFNLSYDVRVPKGANSGVYLRGRYEIQVVDSYGKKVDCHNMAAYYGRVTPSVAVEKKPGEWQHVDVTLYKRHLTVVLNGTTIIDNAPVVGITGGAIDANEFVPGPLYLQGDHSDADYKNMILRKAVN